MKELACLDWPGHEGWSHENIVRWCQTTTASYQEQLIERIRSNNPSRTPHFHTWMKSLRCQLELNRIWKHTASLPLPSLLRVYMQDTDAIPQFYSVQHSYLWKRGQKTSQLLVTLILSLPFLSSAAIDVRSVTHKWRGEPPHNTSTFQGCKNSSDYDGL